MSIFQAESDKPQDEQSAFSRSSVAAETTPEDDAEQGSKQSIEQYMSRLLERVRGLTDTARGPDPQPDQASPSAPVSYAPRFQRKNPDTPRCPENVDTMDAMRELSKLNAHMAIVAHSVKGLIVDAHRKLVMAAAATLITFGVMHLPHMKPESIRALTWLGTLAAVVCGCQFFRVMHQLSGRISLISSAGGVPAQEEAEADAALTEAVSPPTTDIEAG